MTSHFTTVTEISGDDVTQEQVDRMSHRYGWAGRYCEDKDVLEVACGSGQGLGYLSRVARSVCAGDLDSDLVKIAQQHYGDRVPIQVMDAVALPFNDNSFDVVILFEALYYLPTPEKFMAQCRRVLRPGGVVLLSVYNCDQFDFHPSPFSHKYHGAVELAKLAEDCDFEPRLYGYWDYKENTWLQDMLRRVKTIAVTLDLIPKTMYGKKFLKRIVFGKLVPMPSEIDPDVSKNSDVAEISIDVPDPYHRILYCVAANK